MSQPRGVVGRASVSRHRRAAWDELGDRGGESGWVDGGYGRGESSSGLWWRMWLRAGWQSAA